MSDEVKDEGTVDVSTNLVSTSKTIDGVKRVVDVEYNFGQNLDEAIAMFGPEIVHSYFQGQAVVRLQAFVRTRIEAGKTDEEIVADVLDWKPGQITRSTKNPLEEALKSFKKLSPEARRELLASLED